MIADTGELISSENYKDFHMDILEDDETYKIIDKESMYIIMLVRERIQREKFNGEEIKEDED